MNQLNFLLVFFLSLKLKKRKKKRWTQLLLLTKRKVPNFSYTLLLTEMSEHLSIPFPLS